MATTPLQITVVDMLIADNEDLLYAFQVGVPTDLSWDFTDRTLSADFKIDDVPATPVSFSSTSNDGTIQIIDPINRIFAFNVRRDVIHTAGVNNYVYDLLMTDDTLGTVQRLWKGSLTVEQGVTTDEI